MRTISFVAIVFLLTLAPLSAFLPVSAQSEGKALILSSLEKYVPMAYARGLRNSLTSSGYNVTFLNDTQVTIHLLTTELNNYDIVIWRTNAYEWNHTTYWYVGELATIPALKAHAEEFAVGTCDYMNGIIGVSEVFFAKHFPAGSLANVKLMVVIGSMSEAIGGILINAGVKSAIVFNGAFSLAFGEVDYVMDVVFRFLAGGNTVMYSVDEIVRYLTKRKMADPLDTRYVPPIGYTGDFTLTIT